MHLVISGEAAGPFTLEDVRAMWAQGRVNAQTLFYRPGQADWQPLQRIVPELFPGGAAAMPGAHAAQAAAPPPAATWAAGFWRRFGAIVVDGIILGIFGSILGACFFDLFAQMGMMGKLIGAVILLGYFGLQESTLAGGQTLAKRLLRIRVTGRDGRCLPVGLSLLRTALWVVPYSLNGLPITSPLWLLEVLGLYILTFFFATAYLLIFNRRTRQTVYDVLTDSYVVRVESSGAVNLPPVWKTHYVIIAGWCGFWIFLIIGLSASGIFDGFLSGLLKVQKDVAALPDVQYVSVNKSVTFMSGQGSATTSVVVSVTYVHRIADDEKAARDIAAAVLADRADIGEPDYLVIHVGRAYDIGIASGHVGRSFSHTPEEWSEIVAKGG